MWQGLNHRKFPRMVVACDVFVRGEKRGFTLSTMTTNLSRGGLCVMLGRALRKFELVSLKMILRDNEPPLECMGKVCWSIPAKIFRRETSAYDTGIEFINMTRSSGDRIDEYLAEQEKLSASGPFPDLL
ncbi:MAG: PilZ domain-containing protein [Candidatus Omnitrophica bacterium]|nr:PilZ domain-containing protein [Candidatus Omnitrophota bacterium]